MSREFLFVGYLIQTPYARSLEDPKIEIATLDRPIYPALDKIMYKDVAGVVNVTKFLVYLPDRKYYPGYILNGYGIDSSAVTKELGLDGKTTYPSKYEYAKGVSRPRDGLRSLGFDVIDEPAHPFSILHSGPYDLEFIQKNIARLNYCGLFEDVSAAEKFCKFILKDNQEVGTIWEVFG